MKNSCLKSYLIDGFKSKSDEITQLYGVRAIAIILVILHHTYLAFSPENFKAVKYSSRIIKMIIKVLENGRIGVDIFFVLSGFLIGSQLIKELLSSGTINFKKFFIKRTFRIFPAYYVCLLMFIIFFYRDFTFKTIIYNIVYIQNYFYNCYEITWSLAVEEQFYILLPLTIVFFKNLIIKEYSFYRFFLFLIILPLIFRSISYFNMENLFDSNYISVHIFGRFHTRFDQLLTGVVLGYFYNSVKRVNKIFYSSFFQIAVFILFYLLIYYSGMNGSYYKICLQFSVIALVLGIFFLTLLYNEKSLLTRCFKIFPLVFIAKISYSLYLYHYFAIWIINKDKFQVSENLWLNYFFYFVAVTIVSIIFSMASWYSIEFPFLKLRDKILYNKKRIKQ